MRLDRVAWLAPPDDPCLGDLSAYHILGHLLICDQTTNLEGGKLGGAQWVTEG